MGSWIWKKILKYREVAKGFCQVEVGNGEYTSFWYDHWSRLGRLIESAGVRGVIDLGISRTSTVAQAWASHRRRRHRSALLNETEEILFEQGKKRNGKADTVLWRAKNDVFKPHFSTKDTWNHIRTTSTTVSWHKGVWFTHETPKYSFCVWLAVHDRLSTGDRMQRWNGGGSVLCVFCNTCKEIRDHLFFSCDYTQEIWAALAIGIFKAKYTTVWAQLIDHISNSKQDRVETFLTRYLFQTTVYMIWKETNGRRHDEQPHSGTLIAGWIEKQIRNQISMIRRTGDRRYEAAYQKWLQARN